MELLLDQTSYKPLIPGFKNVLNSIAYFVVAAVEGYFSGAYQSKTPVIYKCKLDQCIKSYRQTIWQSQLEETTINHTELDNNADDTQGIHMIVVQSAYHFGAGMS